MAKKRESDEQPTEHRMTLEEYLAQPACKDCGGRPGWNPTTGIRLKDGHTHNCQSDEAKELRK